MDSIRALLTLTTEGMTVSPELLAQAKQELEAVETALAGNSYDGIVVIQNPDTKPSDEVVVCFGELFLVLEDFMLEMRELEAFHYLRSDVANVMVDARRVLTQLNYEPIRTRPRDRITYKKKQ